MNYEVDKVPTMQTCNYKFELSREISKISKPGTYWVMDIKTTALAPFGISKTTQDYTTLICVKFYGTYRQYRNVERMTQDLT